MKLPAKPAALLALFALAASAARAENWPQWRGPTSDGVCAEASLPTEWNEKEGIAWKADISGQGESTPIVWGDRVFLTAQQGVGPITDRGPLAAAEDPLENKDPFNVKFFVSCHSAKDGAKLWEKEVAAGNALIAVHRKHNLATPSCVTDGERVYAWFGTGPLVCLDFDGKAVWERNFGEDYAPFVIKFGHGASPILYKDSLILACEHERKAYITAVDKMTGKTLWFQDRGASKRSYCTPLIINANGRDEMIIDTESKVQSFNPATGEPLWQCKGLLMVPVPMPVFAGGVVYACGGLDSSPSLAVRPGGEGDVTDTQILWRNKTGGPYVPSMVFSGDALYVVNDKGIASCIDAKTGDTVWKERLGKGGAFSASPVLAGGKVYTVNEEGTTFVFDAARQFKIVSENPIGEGERTLASLAASNGKIFLRTDKRLYCIGGK